MPRRIVFIALALVAALIVAAVGQTAGTTGTVTAVLSGDTVQLRLSNGEPARIQVLGVKSPPARSCYAQESAAALRALALEKTVTLRSQSRGRAYIALPDGSDLGRKLISQGLAQVDRWGPVFSRFASYVPLQQNAEFSNRGLWGACAADVSVALTSPDDVVPVGKLITYTATVTNAGPLDAANVDLDVRAPQGYPFETAASISEHGTCLPKRWYATCTFLSVPAHGTVSATFTIDAKAEGTANATALVRLSACISAACGNTPLHDTNLQNDRIGVFTLIVPAGATGPPPGVRKIPLDHWVAGAGCDPHYPTVCIPTPPPDLDCADLAFRGFQVLHQPTSKTPDPHSLDNNFDGIGCQFDDY